MTKGGFGFAIEVTCDGRPVGRAPASLAPCVEDALFAALLSGRVPNDGTVPPVAWNPEWDGGNPPAVAALQLQLGDAPAVRYDADVVAPQARAYIRALIDSGQLGDAKELLQPRDGDATDTPRLSWRLVALEQTPARSRFSARVTRTPVQWSPAALPSTAAGSLDVDIDAHVLTALREDVAGADAVERAWLLVGTLRHDVERGAAALAIRDIASVAEGRGGASQHHFAFEPTAFVAARRRVERRGEGMFAVGWAHSHPPCAGCRDNPACAVDTRFFSTDDVEVHSSAFPSPYMVGLVVGKAADQPATRPDFRLYGWRRAAIAERGFGIAGPVRSAIAATGTTTQETP